jgi:opacity protein-like surface antigen
MKRILLAALVLSLSLSPAAFAQETCESKAVSREGKPLAGAAKTSFLKKCKRDTCQVKAVGSNGRALAGAAKKSFMQKCEREA